MRISNYLLVFSIAAMMISGCSYRAKCRDASVQNMVRPADRCLLTIQRIKARIANSKLAPAESVCCACEDWTGNTNLTAPEQIWTTPTSTSVGLTVCPSKSSVAEYRLKDVYESDELALHFSPANVHLAKKISNESASTNSTSSRCYYHSQDVGMDSSTEQKSNPNQVVLAEELYTSSLMVAHPTPMDAANSVSELTIDGDKEITKVRSDAAKKISAVDPQQPHPVAKLTPENDLIQPDQQLPVSTPAIELDHSLVMKTVEFGNLSLDCAEEVASIPSSVEPSGQECRKTTNTFQQPGDLYYVPTSPPQLPSSTDSEKPLMLHASFRKPGRDLAPKVDSLTRAKQDFQRAQQRRSTAQFVDPQTNNAIIRLHAIPVGKSEWLPPVVNIYRSLPSMDGPSDGGGLPSQYRRRQQAVENQVQDRRNPSSDDVPSTQGDDSGSIRRLTVRPENSSGQTNTIER
jgi:hypothetical protein